jgi:hypothetical protein
LLRGGWSPMDKLGHLVLSLLHTHKNSGVKRVVSHGSSAAAAAKGRRLTPLIYMHAYHFKPHCTRKLPFAFPHHLLYKVNRSQVSDPSEQRSKLAIRFYHLCTLPLILALGLALFALWCDASVGCCC